jgi:hypothetical protein
VRAPSGAPQSPQNFAAGALSAPQRGHRRGSRVPHSEQNFLLSGISFPQLEQRTELLRNCLTAIFCKIQHRKEHFVFAREAWS